jgi:hypothetical protein
MKHVNINRRNLVQLGLGVSALAITGCSSSNSAEANWNSGDLQHILPLVSHHAFNIKVSFKNPCKISPLLEIDGEYVAGSQQDSFGRFWSFRLGGLLANTEYRLKLVDRAGVVLCDSWPLKTFPAPEEQPENLRVISYTCAGGPDLPVLPGPRDAFKPIAYRQRLLDMMLEQKPDLVIANGDHIYWDYKSWVDNIDSSLGKMAMRLFLNSYGSFDDNLPVKGTANESTLLAIADEQIARLYGVRFRSTPVCFVTDDHDYFDNDDATPELVTFPPKDFHQSLRNFLQALYFPEFIVEEPLPADFPGYKKEGGIELSTHFGSVKYGDLFSGLYYDCGGFMTLDKESAGLIPASVEAWLLGKTAQEDSQHLIHVPSHPMGLTAGKWREWYPDLLESEGEMVASVHRDGEGNKYLWQQGWWLQHQRILHALSSQKKRKPLIVSGDLHLLWSGRIQRSGDLDLSSSPVSVVLSGPVGTGELGWPSKARGLSAAIPKALVVEELMGPLECNGFTVLNYTRAECQIEQFKCPEGYVDPEDLTLTVTKGLMIA